MKIVNAKYKDTDSYYESISCKVYDIFFKTFVDHKFKKENLNILRSKLIKSGLSAYFIKRYWFDYNDNNGYSMYGVKIRITDFIFS